MPYAATLAGSTTAPSTSETSSGRVDDLVLLEHGVLGEAAGLGAQPGAGELHAQVPEPTAAVVAPAADDRRHDRDPVADGDVRDLGADLDDPRRELVAEGLRQGRAGQRVRAYVGVTIGPDEVLVQVGTADAAPEHLDEDVVGRLQLEGRRRPRCGCRTCRGSGLHAPVLPVRVLVGAGDRAERRCGSGAPRPGCR